MPTKFFDQKLPTPRNALTLTLKERILAETIPVDSKPGKFRSDGQLLTFLNYL